jgi:hypothetical protein
MGGRLRAQLPGRLVCASVAAACISLLSLAAGAAPALAGAWWRLSARAAPSNLQPGQRAILEVGATDVGDVGVIATTKPVTITDTLPPSLEAIKASGEPAARALDGQMSCQLQPPTQARTVSCTTKPETFPPFEQLRVTIEVNVKPGASTGERNEVNVQGGEPEGQPGVAVPSVPALGQPLSVSGQQTPFGVQEGGYVLTPELEGGEPDRQAGSHPFQLTTALNLNERTESNAEGVTGAAPALPKHLTFNLPPGLIGDPRAVPPCPTADFEAISNGVNLCPAESAIGVGVVTLAHITPTPSSDSTYAVPLWNLEPANGEPARLGFEVDNVPVVLDTSLRSNGDYGVSVSVSNVPETAQLLSSEVTIWGVPGEAGHDQQRGWACIDGGSYDERLGREVRCVPPSQRSSSAFLTLPTSCTGPLRTTVEGESWPFRALGSEPGQVFTLQGPHTEAELPGLEGCAAVPFSPSIAAESTEHAASSPTGLDVNVKVPLQTTVQAGGPPGESDVKSTSVTLPAGVQLNPSAADGLEACSEQQVGFEGKAATADPFSPGAEQPLRFRIQEHEPSSCPEHSKVGSVRIKTPLLAQELQGSVFLATPAPLREAGNNPFNSLIALYIVAEDPAAGIRVKLAGEGELNETTGQVTTRFENTPQLPFEELHVELFAGPRASLDTPPLCAGYSAEASFAPWSGTPALQAFSEPAAFNIETGPEGTPCPAGQQPFAPGMRAGVTNAQGGAFTTFTLDLSRPAADQPVTGLSVHLPPGNAAMLASVTQCPESQASDGTCGPESQIGEAIASSGLGPDPFTVSGGRVYVTGPYEGAPFGLSIVTPAVAGPFNLGNVVVRSKIEVNPYTAQVTISSGLPTFVQGVGRPPSGVPLQLRQIYVSVDRPNFEFNPTNCAAMRVEGTVTGAQGASANVSSPFQVTGCPSLPFNPGVSATTNGKTSKADGAGLGLTFTSHPGEAHIAKTILTIPATLPARLTTIQKACLAKVFEANPAACPEGSDIGSAVVHTPVLKSPVAGPIYLVSHGNAAWPDAELVLQGEGITVILDGQTAIKKGVTTSSFQSVPDVPFETVQVTLPEGPHSALTTNLPAKDKYNVCGQHLTIPTQLTGQNGSLVNDTVKVAVQGCAAVKASKTRKLTRAQKLGLALKACRNRHKQSRATRASCERDARRRYSARQAARRR